ncbi:hypothetical protein NMY22_g246 [Coprinellus aureogranulatus]|nr:hypothetical protein NMY22_g246 [Coprinellus aureogranulatus]
MSLFRPDLWFPESVDFQVQLLEQPASLADYIAATLIATLTLGVQLAAGGYILRHSLLHSRVVAFKSTPWVRKQRRSHLWCYISVALAILYTASVVLCWVAFGQRYASITHLNEFNRTREEVAAWFQDNPDHDGVKTICIPAGVGPGRQDFCKLFKLTRNLLTYKGVETAYASIVQALIVTVDGILVSSSTTATAQALTASQIYRFHMMFSTARWIYPAVGVLSALSLGENPGPVMGIVALGKLAALGTKSDPWWSANFPNDKFLEWHSPWLAIVLPVFVNVVVTIAILARIASTRRRVRNLVGRTVFDSAYLGLTAMLVESALPSALFGVLAVIFHRAPAHICILMKFSPSMLWVAFTVLSPQFIIIRVLQGRAWNKEIAKSKSDADPEGDLPEPSGSTVNRESRTSLPA